MREKGTNTFYMFEDWESEEFLKDDHGSGFFMEMGTVIRKQGYGEMEMGTDKAITMTVKTLETVPIPFK